MPKLSKPIEMKSASPETRQFFMAIAASLTTLMIVEILRGLTRNSPITEDETWRSS